MLIVLITLLVSYLIGSIPFGYLVVRISTGEDVRLVESGRTGGTNVMRAAGVIAGLISLFLDILKGVSSAWVVELFTPGNVWVQVFAALMVIVGHNHSIFLLERNDKGKLRLRGGAGGATCLGGAIALWPGGWIIAPFSMIVFVFIGYASVATLSIGFFAIIIFLYRAVIGVSSYVFIFYGLFAEIILIWALRPNLKRLRDGTERVVGLRASRIKKAAKDLLFKKKITP